MFGFFRPFCKINLGGYTFAAVPERTRRCRAAEKRDELPPLQMIKLHPLPLAGVTAYRIGGDQVSGLLRCGISARLTAALGHFLRLPRRNIAGRFTSISRH